ncbi:type IV fimbrial biogenesis protein FimT [Fontimonas thermophila]|uniref:Type II secretion system protein H n=1 Tax=Fontimonas thermophila TaxID=1076937 RepID=A0A1I2KHQ3_9GAMM|nr:GspH/FimT family pseudopilin [Fontimonas thermophila]SFF66013.1 type IV fimbrial biogenesis protein FimT [Fontimonas thermophila]
MPSILHSATRLPRTPPVAALGLTLIELVVVIAVAGILLAVAVPGFRQLVTANRLTTAANAIVESLLQARLEAVRRNTTTQFCSNVATTNGSGALATACGTAGGAVYVLNADGTTTLLVSAPQPPPGIVLNSSGTGVVALRYTGQGLARRPNATVPYTGLVADLYSTAISRNNRRCIYMTTGSIVSSCAVTSTSGCPTNEPTDCRSQ